MYNYYKCILYQNKLFNDTQFDTLYPYSNKCLKNLIAKIEEKSGLDITIKLMKGGKCLLIGYDFLDTVILNDELEAFLQGLLTVIIVNEVKNL